MGLGLLGATYNTMNLAILVGNTVLGTNHEGPINVQERGWGVRGRDTYDIANLVVKLRHCQWGRITKGRMTRERLTTVTVNGWWRQLK